MKKENLKKATLAGGCFWCTEAVFQRLEGVEKVEIWFYRRSYKKSGIS